MGHNLVLIPGLNNTAETWDGVMKYLPSSIEAISVDVPTLMNMSDIADELLKKLPNEFYLCGFSFGGHVALEMLAKAPERILGISLMASLSTADTDTRKEARANSIKRAKSGEYFEMTEQNAPKTFHPDNMQNEELIELRKKIVQDYGVENYVAHVTAMMERSDHTEELKNSSIPKLMIAGESDQVITAQKVKEIANQLSNVEFKVIPNAGHMVPLEQPKLSADSLSEWVLKESSVNL